MQPVNRTIATGERKETGLLASEQTHELNEKRCTNIKFEGREQFLTQNCTYIHVYLSFKVPLKVKRIRKISNLFFADRCKFKNPGNNVSSGYKAKETTTTRYDSCRDISRDRLHTQVCACVCMSAHLHIVDEIIGVKTSAYIYDRINPRKYRVVHRHKRDRYKYMTTVYTKSTPPSPKSRQESSFV